MSNKILNVILAFVLIVTMLSSTIGCGDGGDDDDDDDGNGNTFTVSVPTLEGPITEPGAPFQMAISSDQALATAGYEANEFFVSGTATSYNSVNDLPADGMWEVEPAESTAYKTRILVYRPVDPAEFNGTLVIEWFNVSGGIEAGPDYTLMHTELLRRGYAWIGVSAQYGGVEGDASMSLGLFKGDLKSMNPERYGALSHPGDSYSYDIYSQVANAIRNTGNVDPLAGYDVERILAVGESQSAFRLTTYINAIHPRVQLFDGFLVHSRGGGASSLGDDIGRDINFSDATYLRTDLDTPVLILQTETDIFELGYYGARQDDTDNIRLWEMAGTAHADLYVVATGAGDAGTDPTVANVVELSNPIPNIIECDLPINSGPQHFIAKAAIHQLDNWVRTGIAPPTADRLEIAGDPPAFVLDRHGNVKGGIRTPYVDVPIARLSGGGQLSESSGCFLFGTTELFDEATLAALYPDHANYVTAVENATDAAVQAGFLMPEDGELIKAAAAASGIGNP
ncbi:alpha/beta hydrolase domain-containing protein [Chloroflexota bacterium]